MLIEVTPQFFGDSKNYEVLVEGVERVAGVDGLTCEIGLRKGAGSYYIMDTLKRTKQPKVHIAIDPYGNIEYPEGDEDKTIRCDYNNEMRDDCLVELYLYTRKTESPFIFFNLEDTEFFARYADGVPVYRQQKDLINTYAFVHFDGPHTARHVRTEIDFFLPRTPKGAVFVFDDVELYDHKTIDEYLHSLGWDCYTQTERKWAYQRTT